MFSVFLGRVFLVFYVGVLFCVSLSFLIRHLPNDAWYYIKKRTDTRAHFDTKN